jgi:hypothetical protein
MPTALTQKSVVEESNALAALAAALDRLQEVITAENTSLASKAAHDHAGFIVRKNHVLKDLMLLRRMEGNKTAIAQLRPRIVEIKGLVERNHQLLKSQVDAMTSITTMLANAAIMESADGTYTRHAQPG